MAVSTNLMPIVSKIYCSPSEAVLMIRKRPAVPNGGGFIVVNSINHKVVFGADGCGILGVSGELILRDGDGTPVLFICKKDGVVQALSFNNRWRGYLMDYEGQINKLCFCLKEPKGYIAMNNVIKISVNATGFSKDWEYEVKGSFLEKDCTITDRRGNAVAQVRYIHAQVMMMPSKDFYNVVVQPGYDQAFVVGVLAVLDNIHGESTRCWEK